jgi:hypothetical protein
MAVNGKNKGNSFERKIANLLSTRFKEVTGIDQARRNPDSGSFFGASNQRRTETHDLDHANFGDLLCPKNFNFSVECKHYKTGPTFSALVKGNITQWDKWLGQASQDAKNSKKEMMLIVKYNGVDEIVFLDAELDGAISPSMIYQTYFIYKLSDILTLGDKFFFSDEQA